MTTSARQFLPILTLLFLAACATPAAPAHEQGWSDARRDIEHDFLHFLAFSKLPPDIWQTNGAPGLQRAVATKVVAQSELEASLKELIAFQDGDDETLSWALLRLGQTHLNIACEIQGMEFPELSRPEQELEVRSLLLEITGPIAEKARTHFAQTSHLGYSPWEESARSLLSELAEFNSRPRQVCQATAPFWDPDHFDPI